MTEIIRVVTAGVDAHADRHEAAVLDGQGRLLGGESFPSRGRGYQELLAWLQGFGQVALVGVESTGSYAAGLVCYLGGQGIGVVEVNQPHAHTRRRRGKSDPIDAEAAARKALAGEAVPKQKDGGHDRDPSQNTNPRSLDRTVTIRLNASPEELKN